MVSIEDMIKSFEEHKQNYISFTANLERLLIELLSANQIHVHSVSSRIKDKNSVKKKIEKKIDKYSSLWDITDISGIRIITYFEDDVDKIGSLIENEFVIDKLNSIDKRKLLDPDRFGYLSLHYVVSISKKRWELPEYNLYRGLKSEVQVRSLLQHAWAEIEHDLGYKSSHSIPKIIWRKLYRLSGLLELADQEFIDIRENLIQYENELPEKITNEPENVSIDSVSLWEYIVTNDTVNNIDRRLIESLSKYGVGRRSITKDNESIDKFIKIFSFLGINSIAHLDKKLIEKEDLISTFAEIWQMDDTYLIYRSGKTLEYLVYILLLEHFDKNSAIDFLTQYSIVNPENIDAFVDKLYFVYGEINST